MSEAAVEVTGVEKVFGRGSAEEVTALSGVDLTVQPGEFVTLIGSSGCGKSTFLRLIGNLLEPTAGLVTVFGKSAYQARLDQDYGMVFQHAGLFDWRKVAGNIELPLELKGWSKADRAARSREMLDLVKLPDFGGHYPRQLSGGMQQRVSIARALINEPSIVLADEPTGNLDSRTSVEVMDIFQALNTDRGITILLITHEQAIAEYGSRIVGFRDGRIVADNQTKTRRIARDEMAALPLDLDVEPANQPSETTTIGT